MRDYAELVFGLRRHHCDAKENDTQEVCEECAYDVIVADKSKFSGITDVCTCGLMHRAADAIEELVAAVPHWISVEEWLPEESGYTIVYCADGDRRHVTFAKYQKTQKRWDLTGARSYWSVLKWMPLPDPPKEVQDA
jgi:hypothetical protein